MIQGVHPRNRHDGPWGDDDEMWAILGGRPLGYRAATLYCKQDMMEHAVTMGLPGHATRDHPCPKCNCNLDSMLEWEGISPLGVPFAPRSLEQYDAACRACEIHVIVTDEVFPRLRGSMRCDRRTTQAGARGYALRAPVPELGLQAGDRLEPSDDMPDHSLFHTTPRPFRATFWRRGAETSARHRNPVFSEETHLSPQELMGDWLHACSLGIFQAYLALLLHTLMARNVFRLPGSTKTDWWVLFAARIRANLFAWYKREKRAGKICTEVQEFSAGMMGKQMKGGIGLHGAEANDFLSFAVESLLPSVDGFLEKADLLEAGRALLTMLRLLRSDDAWRPGHAQDTCKQIKLLT